MISLNEYFDGRIFCINLAKRHDRWEHAKRQFETYGIAAKRFEACVVNDEQGRPHGNSGCVASHRALLDMQIAAGWPRLLALEDDFSIIYHDFNERVDRFLSEVPPTWDMLFLGAGLAEPPQSRVSSRVIRVNGLMTTSSYGITLAQARKMAPHISGGGPIDSLYQPFERQAETYLIDPVAIVQFPDFSDLQERPMDNSASMLTRDLSGMV